LVAPWVVLHFHQIFTITLKWVVGRVGKNLSNSYENKFLSLAHPKKFNRLGRVGKNLSNSYENKFPSLAHPTGFNYSEFNQYANMKLQIANCMRIGGMGQRNRVSGVSVSGVSVSAASVS